MARPKALEDPVIDHLKFTPSTGNCSFPQKLGWFPLSACTDSHGSDVLKIRISPKENQTCAKNTAELQSEEVCAGALSQAGCSAELCDRIREQLGAEGTSGGPTAQPPEHRRGSCKIGSGCSGLYPAMP